MIAKPLLVLGATGYVGKRLVPYLVDKGFSVRAGGRSIAKLKSLPWVDNPEIELAVADVFDRDSLLKACEGCFAVYYFVHSLNPQQLDFSEADRKAAVNMAWAAERAGVERIIYLGGLGEESVDLSDHLRSRAEVGEVLQSGSVPVTFLRAAMIIGSGSASFEILRYIVDRLPVMITPRWVSTRSQPIAISNVLTYLAGCLAAPETEGKTFDIGGPDIMTYRQLMEIYNQEARLPKRLIIPVPVLTPQLSSYWIRLVTPIPSALARPLVEGLKNPTVCKNDSIREIIPQDLLDCRQAIRRSLEYSHHDLSDKPDAQGPSSFPPEGTYPGDPEWAGGTRFRKYQRVIIEGNPKDVWRPIQRIGGKTGWYCADWLWQLRGLVDMFLCGVGFSRGRKSDSQLKPGDNLDFWKVKTIDPEKELLLTAEMKMPGCALLDFRIRKVSEEKTELEQKSWFIPSGNGGILNWYLLYPPHRLIFTGMLREIARRMGKPLLAGPKYISIDGPRNKEKSRKDRRV